MGQLASHAATPLRGAAWVSHALGAWRKCRGAAPARVPETLGRLAIDLPQREATARALAILHSHGGALLAEQVGQGKTRIALATASLYLERHAGPLLCCVPARLMPMWRQALDDAGLSARAPVQLVSHAAMSQPGALAIDPPALILVDEAHRFKNPAARRSARLTQWAAAAPTLLISATPIARDLMDLYHLLAIFLAEDALLGITGRPLREVFMARDHASILAVTHEVVVRRASLARARPAMQLEALAHELDDEERWLWQHLPDALRALSFALCGATWPRALAEDMLCRRWESGPRALLVSLDALLGWHERWLDAASRGVTLDRDAFNALFLRDVSQEVLPFMLPRELPSPDDDLIAKVTRDCDALRALRARVEGLAARGSGRERAIAALLASEPWTRALVFTQWRDTALALESLISAALGARARVGLITGMEARATGLGQAPAQTILERFAPVACGVVPPPEHQALRVLIATDCLAHGVDLQDCGCVILADAPTTPLLMEQRIGRLLRPGGPHLRARVIAPRPRHWAGGLGMRRMDTRLDARLDSARQVGLAMPAAEVAAGITPHRDDPLAAIAIMERLAAHPSGAAHAFGADAHATTWWRAGAGPLIALARWEDLGSPLWMTASPDGQVSAAPADALAGLMRLRDTDLALEPLPDDDPLREQLLRFAAALVTRRLGIALAPPALPMRSPQVLLWRRISAWASVGARPDDRALAQTLRARLLRPLPRGLTRALEAQLEQPPSLALLHTLDTLLPPPPPEDTTPRLRWLAAARAP